VETGHSVSKLYYQTTCQTNSYKQPGQVDAPPPPEGLQASAASADAGDCAHPDAEEDYQQTGRVVLRKDEVRVPGVEGADVEPVPGVAANHQGKGH